MLDLFISMITGVLAGSVGFYGGYKLGHINGQIKQLELDEERFDKLMEEMI
jgi:hypothetical protein